MDEPRLDARMRAVRAERAAIAKAETMQQQVLLCTSVDCDAAGDPAGALKTLKHEVAWARLRHSIMVTEVSCLEICEHGPIALVHPDGTWYAAVDEDAARRIVREHLVGGEPVADHAFLTSPLQTERPSP